jgi:hypothetical protein
MIFLGELIKMTRDQIIAAIDSEICKRQACAVIAGERDLRYRERIFEIHTAVVGALENLKKKILEN